MQIYRNLQKFTKMYWNLPKFRFATVSVSRKMKTTASCADLIEVELTTWIVRRMRPLEAGGIRWRQLQYAVYGDRTNPNCII